MKVSELGEFGLIDLVAKMAPPAPESQASKRLILGIGDDAAAWQGDTSTQLATVDDLIQGVHFSLDTTPWEELGWKALAINLSDIAAMGGVPAYALVSLALPPDTEVEDVTALYRGMVRIAQQYGVAIVGGDTCRAPLVIITVTVLGNAKTILTRSAAKPGEQIAVTGKLGAAAAGLKMLTEKLQLDSESATSLRQAFFRPHPRIAESQLLVEHGVKTAIDISDGLMADLNHICQASRVSTRIDIDRVPIHPAVKANFADQAVELAISGGEDYELLFTASADVIDRVKAKASSPVTVIGKIEDDKDKGVSLVDSQGNPFKLAKTGWEHFTTQ